MKLLYLTMAILFVAPVGAHDELFPNCSSKHPAHDIENTRTTPKPVAIYKEPPEYPTTKRTNGAVILEYTVTKEGETTDIKVLSSSSGAFSSRAIKALRAFRYQPVLVEGKPVATKGLKHKFAFEFESSKPTLFMESETLDFDPSALSKFIKSVSRIKTKTGLERISKALEKETNGFHKAVLYYIQSSKEYDLNPENTNARKKSLELSLVELKTLNQDEHNVINLRSMAIAALSSVLIFEEKNQETIDLLAPFLKEAWSNNFIRPKVIYDATVNFSIASYNARELCYAYNGFDRAIQQGNSLGIKNPNWVKYRDTAKKHMKD